MANLVPMSLIDEAEGEIKKIQFLWLATQNCL